MAWQDDYYLGSSDYPVTGADDDVDPDEERACDNCGQPGDGWCCHS